MTSAAKRTAVTGFLLAVGSAASFALSGIFASSLMTAGWSAGAAATARISVAAAVLLVPTLLALRGQWHQVLRAWKPILLFGLLAIVACQLAYFLAVEFIAPSLALLIEFMGPVLLMLWIWARSRVSPPPLTLVGAAIAVVGLVTLSGLASGGALHPLGIIFALVAAVGNAAYYAAGASSNHGIAPLPFVGLGLLVAAIGLGIVCAVGILPFTITNVAPVVAGVELSPALVVAAMALISTVIAYVLGVSASRRLGATVASFTGYSEPMFGIVWTIVLLAIVPTGTQWLGAALILAGVVTVKLGEMRAVQRRVTVP
ncbi:drug/metabolite transporter (DMT)-like permease [Leucobacter exalbidus]|uniref:Drug/metabolite transporter (DMT)-like permease n=1 Tax=Leucobacter exalbidus TaxID=662960 RepID=A0A940PLN4_9MICO|nr:DMT family transporter [Leucobacter exalbidus]MBP1325373.1 drug/metabolite transporter (DMT)-like permease [Leucobacter exalbidus]